MKRLFQISIIIALLTAVSAYSVNRFYWGLWQNDIDVAASVVDIEQGASASKVFYLLQAHGRLPNSKLFYYWFRLQGFDGIKAGEYEWSNTASASELWSKMKKGEVITYPLVIIEGWNSYEILEYLKQQESINYDLAANTPQELAKELGLSMASIEGFLAPDTYTYERGASAKKLLKKMVVSMSAWLDEAWSSRIEGLPIQTPYEMLILASIIEKETGIAQERPAIASVFINRLNKKMRLQTDPTVIYGLEPNFNGDITRKNLRQKTPWNTYVIKGLPPTPIASPSRAALMAVGSPDRSDFIYFVATGDGGHKFSRTLKEHNAAVRSYLARVKK